MGRKFEHWAKICSFRDKNHHRDTNTIDTIDNCRAVCLSRVVCGPKKGRWFAKRHTAVRLTTESVEGPALSLESIDYVHSGDGLPLGMLGVGDCITDNVFQEHL